MKLSDALVEIYHAATDSPKFKELKGSDAVKLYKALYKEVLAVEEEGKDFNADSK